jgi:nitrogen fixation protein NifT
MKVTLHQDRDGNLMIYVPKKDLEEPIVHQVKTDDAYIFTLSNGWELAIAGLEEPFQMPQTIQARKLN